jgi:hypothetical protein
MTALCGPLGTRACCALATRCSLVLVYAIFLLTACSKPSPTSPTGPAPVASLAVTVDGNASVAIPAVSMVSFDASSSTGDGLSFRLDLGDGTVVNGPRANHVYAEGGRWNSVVLTVTDSIGRVSTLRRDVVVANITKYWIAHAYKPTAGRTVILSLTITSQQGTAVSGTFSDDDGMSLAVSGQLLPERGIALVLGSGEGELVGRQPDGFDGSTVKLILNAKGGWTDGQKLQFAYPLYSIAGR